MCNEKRSIKDLFFHYTVTRYTGIARYTLNITQISLFFGILLTLLLASTAAHAQNECEVRDSDWNPPSAGPIVTWTAPVCEAGKLIAQPYFLFNRTRGVFDSDSHYKSYVDKDSKWQWQEQLFLSYGLTNRWELDVLGTYQQNIRKISGASAESTGFGDTYIFSSYCVQMEEKWMPCIAAWFQLKIPTGKYQKPEEGKLWTDLNGATTGGGSYEEGYGFILTKHVKPFILHADAIWGVSDITRVEGVKVRYGNYAKYDLGAEYFFYKGFNLLLEMNALVQGDRTDDGMGIPSSNINSLTICPGIGWSNNTIQTLFAYQRTIAGTNTDVNDSFVFTFAYTF